MRFCKKSWSFLLLILVVWPGGGVAKTAEVAACRAVEVDPRSVVGGDDLDGAGLDDGVAASLRYLARLPADKSFTLCDRRVSVAELRNSLVELRRLWRESGSSKGFPSRLADRFVLLAANHGGGENRVLLTGYFEPLLEGALTKGGPFLYPLYPVPADLVHRDGEVGRLDGGRLVPYWSRAEIEEGKVLSGSELLYLNDPVEAFILQVQGSGRVRLRDGSLRRLQFADKNGRPYRSIGKFLVERGVLGLDEVSLPAISSYLKSHPDEISEVLHYNESYVFFRWGDPRRSGPLGSLGEALTPQRSVALDQECFPPGAPAFLLGRKPVFNNRDEIVGWSRMQRLVFNHDSGSAIRGSGRLDLFLGYGARARATAGIMKGQGRLYFLLRKK